MEDSEFNPAEYLILRDIGGLYAINIQNIVTIIHDQSLRYFPNLSEKIIGTTIFNETLIPVFDLPALINKQSKKLRKNNAFYIIVIKENDEFIGINVEKIHEIIEYKKKPRQDALLSKNKNHLFSGSIKLSNYSFLSAEKELVNVIDIKSIYNSIEKELINDEF